MMPTAVASVIVLVRSDMGKPRELLGPIDRMRALEVTRRIPLAQLPVRHAEAVGGRMSGKVIVIS